MSSLYINTLPNPLQNVTALSEAKKTIKFKIGFENDMPLNELRKKFLPDIVSALLLHDQLIMNTKHVMYLTDILGIEDTIKLLRADIIKSIDDYGLSFAAVDENSHFHLIGFRDTSATHKPQSGAEWLEDRLIKHKKVSKAKTDLILINVERNNMSLPNDVEEIIQRETTYDLQNQNLTSNYGLLTTELSQIHTADLYKVLRIVNLNRALVYSAITNTNNIAIDAEARTIVEQKISPVLQKTVTPNPQAIFGDTIYKKGVPDFSNLLEKGIISIDDILRLRENFHGKRFREWCEERKYDKDEIEKGLFTSGDSLYIRIPKLMRWVIPETVGAIAQPIGFALSAAESFLLDKVLNKWHPNLFLDNELKRSIDRKVADYEKLRRQGERQKICPCSKKRSMPMWEWSKV